MTDTIHAPTREAVRPETSERPRPNLWPTVAVLTILLLGLAAWVIYDLVAESALSPTAEISQLVDDYNAAWNQYDGEAFAETTRAGYTFTSSAAGTFDRETQQRLIETTLRNSAWHMELLDEPMMVGDGPRYLVSFPVEIETLLRGTRQGMALLTVYETLDGDLLVMDHVYVGR